MIQFAGGPPRSSEKAVPGPVGSLLAGSFKESAVLATREHHHSRKHAMAKIELDTLSLDELQQLRKDADKAIADYEKRKRQEALAAAEAAALASGYSLSELIGDVKVRKDKGRINPPKYSHPENPKLTWTGKGRQPAWIKEAIGAGKPMDELLIAT